MNEPQKSETKSERRKLNLVDFNPEFKNQLNEFFADSFNEGMKSAIAAMIPVLEGVQKEAPNLTFDEVISLIKQLSITSKIFESQEELTNKLSEI